LELLRVTGDDVEVTVEEHGELRVGRPDVGDEHRQPADLELVGLDLAGLEPALDEPGTVPYALVVGAVVGDEFLGQYAFVHFSEGGGPKGEPPPRASV